ncbi:TetR/AcrR family transcriptional regulator [Aquihabitans sp. McL0605]|uniref:TetR/AcrR family transcriptional regulator n=1 Tax=Aquihabitans sp. McL0605 TaxID=3415671 RepID=UPI003CEDC1D5
MASIDEERTDAGAAASPRRTWRYGELTRDHVVEAALELTLREGLGALSMRKLADELGISSMNAYYHVPNKRALLDLVADAVLGQVPAPPDDRPWDQQLAALFEGGREVLLRYPGVAEHLLVRTEGHANEERLYRIITGILRSAGFDREVSDRTQRTMAYLLFGAVTSELATASAGDDVATMSFTDDEQVFRFGLDLMLDGLRTRRRRAQRAAARTR